MDKKTNQLCDQEPIHIPGSIQSHGMLIVVDGSGFIRYCSENLAALIGIESTQILDKSVTLLNTYFGKPADSNFIGSFIELAEQGQSFAPLNPYHVTIGRCAFNMILSRTGDYYILDFEPEGSDLMTDPQQLVGASLSEMLADRDLDVILDNAAAQVRRIIGYDRVMIYKFHPDGHGEVVAEDRDGELESWLGLHYPASDIPKQARELYKHNLTRLIADAETDPSPLLTHLTTPIDLTNSNLRAVSPIHIRYLKNMGVRSSFSISILVNDELWGLIACHNYSPRFINFKQRETAKLVGQVLSSCVGMRQQENEQKERLKLQTIMMQVTRCLQDSNEIASLMKNCAPDILRSYCATGMAFVLEGEIYTAGDVPTTHQIEQIAEALGQFQDIGLLSTVSAAQDLPSIKLNPKKFSGILGSRLTQELKDCIILFRPEQSAIVKWAGDPTKLVSFDQDGLPFISPRNSFEEWVQQVSGQSEAWSTLEEDTLLRIRDEINFTIGRKSNELRLLNEKLRLAYAELDAFAYTVSHDLKTPITAIKAYAELIQRRTEKEDIGVMADRIRKSSITLTDMIKTVLEYSKIGQKNVNKQRVDMAALLNDIREQLLISNNHADLQLIINFAPELEGDPVLLFQVFLNVIDNAVKYSSKVPKPEIRIEGFNDGNETVYRISDNGVGIKAEELDSIFGLFSRVGKLEEYDGTGIGLATVKKIMTRHGADIRVESQEGYGSTFILRFPNANSI